jgi:hypothetical protein
LPEADSIGVAVARNENARYKVYWAMVIGRKEAKRRTEVAAAPSSPAAAKQGGKGERAVKPEATQEPSVGTLLTGAVTRLRSLMP